MKKKNKKKRKKPKKRIPKRIRIITKNNKETIKRVTGDQ